MPTLEAYRKRAKLLTRWHRERNYSLGGLVRLLARYREITDREVLAMDFPLALAQEVVAVEAGYPDWAALKRDVGDAPKAVKRPLGPAALAPAVPVLFVRDVAASAAFYCDILGFAVDFLHGNPPFYGSVSRGGARLHLRGVAAPNFAELAEREGNLILAMIGVENGAALYEEFREAGADFAQKPTKQAWGGTDFHVRDPDGNVIAFVSQ